MCSLHSKRNLSKSGQKILDTLMAFNDFSMVLTVVVFCIFFSVLHYKVTAFVSALINLCYLILNIILYKHNRHE